MNYYENILDTVGNTPLVRLNSVVPRPAPVILAKIEPMNPGGSNKDRIAINMLNDAEEKGMLKSGGTIIEPTSGNTGMGLAMVASLRGYKCIFTMPDKMSMEKENLLRAFGADVIRTPTDVPPDDPRSYYKVAEKLLHETPNSFSPDQYHNDKNPEAHYLSTGPEIWRDTDGKITHYVAGVGTGGTISGVARFLKEKNPGVKVVGADPVGSIYYGRFYNEEENIHMYKIEGIGEDFIPDTVDLSIIDEIIRIEDKESFIMTRRLAREEGLLLGSSSGAAVVAAVKLMEKLDNDALVVALLPDTGRNYLSTVFNDEWMKKQGFLQD
ncbi:MAG TPA: cysteine synthase [bacterium]|jgi:cystathionine beta-synthase